MSWVLMPFVLAVLVVATVGWRWLRYRSFERRVRRRAQDARCQRGPGSINDLKAMLQQASSEIAHVVCDRPEVGTIRCTLLRKDGTGVSQLSLDRAQEVASRATPATMMIVVLTPRRAAAVRSAPS